MNYRFTSYILGQIALIEAILLSVPFILAISYGDDTVLAFGITIFALVLFGVPLTIKKPVKRDFSAKEGFATVALSWLVMSLFGCLPFVISGYIPNFIDALFETISGFTTTGASILTDIEALPKSLLFWRSLTHWIGGMGILVFVIAIIPKSEAKIIHLFRAESPGPQVGKLVSKLKFTARILYSIYIALTLIEVVLLLIGDMSLYDSFIHAFGTAATGGFSNRNASVASYDSLYIDIVITVFMFLFAINFNIYFMILIGSIRQVIKSEELKVFLGIILVSSVIITLSLTINSVYDTFGETLRYTFFQVGALLSTTGFATADYTTWPLIAQFTLFALMFIGGCAGSTGGGLKVARIIILVKASFRELKRAVSPRTILKIKYENKPLDPYVYNGVVRYFVIYMIIFSLSVILVSITAAGNTSTDMINSITAVTASLNNIGPGFGDVGPTGNYAFFSGFAKIILAFNMLVGRLEILPMLLLFNPKLWSNKL